MSAVNFNLEEKVVLTLEPKTASGNPAAVDGAPVWEVVSGDIILTPSEDGLSCQIDNNGVVTPFEIKVSADADLDEDEVRTIEVQVVGAVTAVEADSLGVTAVVTAKD